MIGPICEGGTEDEGCVGLTEGCGYESLPLGPYAVVWSSEGWPLVAGGSRGVATSVVRELGNLGAISASNIGERPYLEIDSAHIELNLFLISSCVITDSIN